MRASIAFAPSFLLFWETFTPGRLVSAALICSSVENFTESEMDAVRSFVAERDSMKNSEADMISKHDAYVESLLGGEAKELNDVQRKFDMCKSYADKFFADGTITEDNYNARLKKCFDYYDSTSTDITTKYQKNIQSIKDFLEKKLAGLKNEYLKAIETLAITVGNSTAWRCAEDIELQERLIEAETARLLSLKELDKKIDTLRQALEDDQVCCNIENVSRAFDIYTEGDLVSSNLERAMNRALQQMGLDVRMEDTYISKNEFIPYPSDSSFIHVRHRALRSSSRYFQSRRLGTRSGYAVTGYTSQLICSRCTDSDGISCQCTCCRRRTLDEEFTFLDGGRELAGPSTVDDYMQIVSEKMKILIRAKLNDMISEGSDSATVQCWLCGLWGFHDDVRTLNVDQLQDHLDFSGALDICTSAQIQATLNHKDKCDARQVELIGKLDELKSQFDIKKSQYDHDLRQGTIDAKSHKLSVSTLIAEYDIDKAEELVRFAEDVDALKHTLLRRYKDIADKISRIMRKCESIMIGLFQSGDQWDIQELGELLKKERMKQNEADKQLTTVLEELESEPVERFCITVDNISGPLDESEQLNLVNEISRRAMNDVYVRAGECFLVKECQFSSQSFDKVAKACHVDLTIHKKAVWVDLAVEEGARRALLLDYRGLQEATVADMICSAVCEHIPYRLSSKLANEQVGVSCKCSFNDGCPLT